MFIYDMCYFILCSLDQIEPNFAISRPPLPLLSGSLWSVPRVRVLCVVCSAAACPWSRPGSSLSVLIRRDLVAVFCMKCNFGRPSDGV